MCDREVKNSVQAGRNWSTIFNNTIRQEDTSTYPGPDSKDVCEAGNDVWTRDSSDDRET